VSVAAGASEEFRDGMPFVGGWLWLDLLNTVLSDRGTSHDLIATPPSLATWLANAGLRGDGREQSINGLRELLRTAVDPLRLGGRVPPDVLSVVNEMLAGVRLKFRLDPDGDALRLVETLDLGETGPAGAIASDFARFVCDHEPQRLRRCDNPACTMVFYDRGKNNTRRWCTMSICGNRDKVARYRARLADREASNAGNIGRK